MPRVGLYVNMLSKVMMTVLNFFASYVWHFLVRQYFNIFNKYRVKWHDIFFKSQGMPKNIIFFLIFIYKKTL